LLVKKLMKSSLKGIHGSMELGLLVSQLKRNL